MSGARLRRLGLAALALPLVGACGRAGPPPGLDRARLTPRLAADDEVIAEVDGVPIAASAIRLEGRSGGGDARQALARLVDAEALAAAALARGLADDFEVLEATRAAAVRRLLHDVLEREASAEAIPEADYRALYEQHRDAFDHDETVEVWHLVALLPAEAKPEHKAAARAAILPLVEPARAAASAEAFAALAPPAGAAPLAATIKAERLTFPRHGVVEEPFAAAAFALERPGQVSGLVETRYGYHLIRLVARTPARHVGLDGARAELREAALLRLRRRKLDAWVRELTEKSRLELHAERLSRLGEDGPR